MVSYDPDGGELRGAKGSLPIRDGDEVMRKACMLIEGECEGLGATAAAHKYGYSRQRYYQVLNEYREHGSGALRSGKPGPKTNYRRTEQAVREVIRHVVLDPAASADVIAQKMKQVGMCLSRRSVQRVLDDYGLEKKTP